MSMMRRMTMTALFSRGISIGIFLLFFMVSMFGTVVGVSSVTRGDYIRNANFTDSLESSVIAGYVFDTPSQIFLSNHSVIVVGDHYVGKSTSTNLTGWYSVQVPEGVFTVMVKNQDEMEIYCTTLTIGSNETKRFDILVDTNKTENSVVSGVVVDSNTGEPLKNIDIRIIPTSLASQAFTMKTDSSGIYNFTVISGSYRIEYRFLEDIFHTRTLEVHWGEEKSYNDTFIVKTEEQEKEYFLKETLSAVKEKWYYLLGIAITGRVCPSLKRYFYFK